MFTLCGPGKSLFFPQSIIPNSNIVLPFVALVHVWLKMAVLSQRFDEPSVVRIHCALAPLYTCTCTCHGNRLSGEQLTPAVALSSKARPLQT